MKKTFYSNGKLLLTGEYVVLDGAKALAMPAKFGQNLLVEDTEAEGIQWKSLTVEGDIWFEEKFNSKDNFSSKTETAEAKTLTRILQEAKKLNPSFLSEGKSLSVTTQLSFPRIWGLGSSSTLINNIAQWAQVNAFTLLQNSFGGSGYDIAAAQKNSPFFYQLINGEPSIQKVHLPWDFKDLLFFVHLNKKQDSKEGIERYKSASVSVKDIQKISDLSKKLLLCYSLSDFEKLMESHERIISETIKLPTVKEMTL